MYDYKLTQLRPESWNALCDGPILSWDDKLDEKYPDAYPYAKEKRDGPILWIIPDHTMKNSQVKAYDLIKFSDALNSVRYLTSGWYATEKWGVWSEEDAKISLTLPNNCAIDGNCILRLKMHLFNATNSAPKSIHIGINGTNINSFIVVDGAPHSYTVPLKTNNSNIELTIKVPEAVSPSVSGLSDDKRTLGVGLHSIQLTYN